MDVRHAAGLRPRPGALGRVGGDKDPAGADGYAQRAHRLRARHLVEGVRRGVGRFRLAVDFSDRPRAWAARRVSRGDDVTDLVQSDTQGARRTGEAVDGVGVNHLRVPPVDRLHRRTATRPRNASHQGKDYPEYDSSEHTPNATNSAGKNHPR